MNAKRKELRAAIAKMSPREAKYWVSTFQLRYGEEKAILLCDVRGMSIVEASHELSCSPEAISRNRARGYDRILRDLDGNIPS